jgi:hypothetical protein
MSKRPGGRVRLPRQCRQRLLDAGLLVVESERKLLIGKPPAVRGNSAPEVDWGLGCDAPLLRVWRRSRIWYLLDEPVPLGVPLEPLARKFRTADEVVAEALDFYFGDGSRMRDVANSLQPPSPDALAELDEQQVAHLELDTVDEPCRMEGCSRRRVRFTAFCPGHFLEAQRAAGTYPTTD